MSRAWLFVPGHRPDRFDKALAAGADRVIVDLEDAVAPDDKVGARAALASWLASTSARVAVRLNAADTTWFADDLALVDLPAVAAVVLPKAEDPALLAVLAAGRQGLALVPLIESAAGIAAARALAAAPGVERLAFGHLDFQGDLGLRDATEDELAWARRVLAAAQQAGGAAIAVDGKMVDRPVILRAEAILRDPDLNLIELSEELETP